MPTAASCSLADVNTAIGLASAGDTVTVPAGSATWAGYPTISKRIKLIGNGIGNTNITLSGAWGISVTPDAAFRASELTFRISGFTFKGAPTSGVLTFTEGNSETVPNRNIRVDHCRFENTVGLYTIYVDGNFWGVIDNNQFAGRLYFGIYGNQDTNYTEFYPVTCGTVDNLYFEQNTFNSALTDEAAFQSGHAGRYAVRYNTFNFPKLGNPFFDQHGSQTYLGGDSYNVYALMMCEIYENTIAGVTTGVNRWEHARGGKVLMFNNTGTSSSGTPGISVNDQTRGGANDPPPIYTPHDCYFWNNVWNTVRVDCVPEEDDYDTITEDKTYWNENDSFDTSSGIGVGLLADRPTITLTTDIGAFNYAPVVGTAYWATDTSTLYRVTSAGVWETYYTPYEYPHPLREENPPWGFSHSEKVVLTVSANEVGRLYVDIPKKRAVVGTSVVFTLHAEPWNDFVGDITLDITGLPTNATDTYGTNPIAYNGTTTATVTTVGVAAGTYDMNITGTSAGGDVASVRVVLEIVEAADADIKIPIKKIRAKQGDNAVFTISADSLPGYTSDVDLSVSGVPAGASSSFGDASLAYNGTTTLTIDTGTADLGEHDVIITGVGPG